MRAYFAHFWNYEQDSSFRERKKNSPRSNDPTYNYEFGIQFPADLAKFTEEILNGKLHFLCSVRMAENLQKYFSVIYTSNKLRMIFREIFTAKRNFLFFSIMWKSFECLFSQNFVRNNQSVITFTYFFQLQ